MSQKNAVQNQDVKSGNKYNVIIVGAGKQGCFSDAPGSGNEHKIISFAHAVTEHPGFELNGFYDSDHTKSLKAQEYWGGCAFATIERALNPAGCKKPDVVVIATPDNLHYELLKHLAYFPLKLVIVEKPLCTNLQQAREVVELYKAKGRDLCVNYTRMFLPYYEELRQRYLSGEFGKLIWGKAVFNRGLLHTGTHAISFLNWIEPRPEHKHSYFCLEPFENYRIWQIELFFEKYHWQEQRIGDMPVWPYYDKSHWHVVENAYQFLQGREPLKCTAEDALRTLEICFELMTKDKPLMEGAK